MILSFPSHNLSLREKDKCKFDATQNKTTGSRVGVGGGGIWAFLNASKLTSCKDCVMFVMG